jgi:hypothetical protein
LLQHPYCNSNPPVSPKKKEIEKKRKREVKFKFQKAHHNTQKKDTWAGVNNALGTQLATAAPSLVSFVLTYVVQLIVCINTGVPVTPPWVGRGFCGVAIDISVMACGRISGL